MQAETAFKNNCYDKSSFIPRNVDMKYNLNTELAEKQLNVSKCKILLGSSQSYSKSLPDYSDSYIPYLNVFSYIFDMELNSAAWMVLFSKT